MVGSLRFISSNVAGDAYSKGVQEGDQRRDAEFARREQLRQLANQAALDRAQRAYVDQQMQPAPVPQTQAPPVNRQVMDANDARALAPQILDANDARTQPPAPAAPAAMPVQEPTQRDNPLRMFTAIPGGGQVAMSAMATQQQAQKQTQTQAENRIYELLKANDETLIGQAAALARQHQVDIPPQVFTDRTARARLLGSIKMIEDLAKANGMPFEQLQAALDNGDTSALAKLVSSMQPKVKQYLNTNEGIFAADERGNVTPVAGTKGAPLRQQRPDGGAGAGGAGKQSVFQQKQSAWLATHPGDEQGALEYASGRRQVSVYDVQRMAISMAQKDQKVDFALQDRDAFNERVADYVRRLTDAKGTGTPAPAAQPGTSAPNPLQEYQAARQRALQMGRQDLVLKIDERARKNGVIR